MDANKRQEISEQLSAYLDEELSPVEAERVAGALRENAELARELAELRATRELLRRLPREKAGEDFAAQVLARAERVDLVGVAAPQAPRRRFSWARRLTAAAVLLIAAGIGVVVGMQFWPKADMKVSPGSPARPVGELARDKLPAGPSEQADKSGLSKGTKVGLEGREMEERWSVVVANGKVHGKVATPGSPILASDITNEFINTSIAALPETQREVEKILKFNSIEPLTIEAERAVRSKDEYLFRANFSQRQARANQANYTLIGTPEQLANVRRSLDKLRSRQDVSQAPIAMDASSARQARTDMDKLLAIAGVQDGRFALKGVTVDELAKPAKADDEKKFSSRPSPPAGAGGAGERGAIPSPAHRPGESKAEPDRADEAVATKPSAAPKPAPPSPAGPSSAPAARDAESPGGTGPTEASRSELARTSGEDSGKATFAAKAKDDVESAPPATQPTTTPATQPASTAERFVHKETQKSLEVKTRTKEQLGRLAKKADEGKKNGEDLARLRSAATQPAGRMFRYRQRAGANVSGMIITLNAVAPQPATATTRITGETRSADAPGNNNERNVTKEPTSKPTE